jgi:Cys-Gly metallodipeptidase DUG1
MSAPAKFIDFIDSNADKFIQRLADAVAIPRSVVVAYGCKVDLSFLSISLLSSISGDASRRGDVVKMALFLNNQLKSYGVETKLVELGEQTLEGKQLKLPPAILGQIGSDPKKKTVLIYGHFDVQPVSLHAFDLLLYCRVCLSHSLDSITTDQLQHFGNAGV